MSIGSIVYVIDDDPTLREAIAFLLSTRGVAAMTFPSAEAFIEAYSQNMRGCILTDVRMSGMSGLELFARLDEKGNKLPCIVLTGHGDVPMAVDALKRGAFDFVEKPFDGNALVDRLVAAIDVDRKANEASNRRRSTAERIETLSDREREVMQMLLAGKMNKVIAANLGIAIRTVEAHRARIFEKMGVKSAVELSSLLTDFRLS